MPKEIKRKFKVRSDETVNEERLSDLEILETLFGGGKLEDMVEGVDFSKMGIDDLLEFVNTNEVFYMAHLDSVLARFKEINSNVDVENTTEEVAFKLFKLMNILKYAALTLIERLEVLETSLNYFVGALRYKFVRKLLLSGKTLECDVDILGQRELRLELSWQSVNMKLMDKETQTCLWEFKDNALKSCTVDRVYDCFLEVDGLIEIFVDEMGDGFDQ